MYITNQDYIDFTGVNLEFELYDGDNVNGKVDRFINRVENWCINYLSDNYDFDESMIESTPFMDKFKKGLMCQMSYILNNGWNISELDPEAYMYFRRCGFCNLRKDTTNV